MRITAIWENVMKNEFEKINKGCVKIELQATFFFRRVVSFVFIHSETYYTTLDQVTTVSRLAGHESY